MRFNSRHGQERSRSRSRSRSDFETVKHLAGEVTGTGNQGIVLVKEKRTSVEYIEKRLPRRAVKNGFAARELRALAACTHPHIIELVFADLKYRTHGYGSIYMAYCELGSVEDYIRRRNRDNRQTPEGMLWKVLWDISNALCYLQTGLDQSEAARRGQIDQGYRTGWEKILHCDVKPGNLFLTDRGREGPYPEAILGDFGCSMIERDTRGPNMFGYTPQFAAPECPRYSDTGDVYSLALSLYCLATLKMVPDSQERVVRDPAPGCSIELASVLDRMLQTRHEDRVTARLLPWLTFHKWREAAIAEERAQAAEKTAAAERRQADERSKPHENSRPPHEPRQRRNSFPF